MKSTLAFIIFVIAFVSCPVCFLLTVNADAATLDCQRVEPGEIHCTRTLWILRIIPYERTAINDLRGAELAKDDCSDGCFYRVGLSSDTVYTLAPVSAGWSHDREAKQELADQINAFVEDESATYLFVIEGADTTSWVVLILLGGAWIVGTLLVIFGRNIFWPKRG
ncbi:hypothetical protein TFLX_00826 [Thermoflexales bacterium]|nr:hypothetical protein TFLX_00826 [Thermoflexales bacterium]